MAGNYYVHVHGTRPPVWYGPYALDAAKHFARIGSQTGAARVVTRGLRGDKVRVYEGGVRAWPVTGRSEATLPRRERPAKLNPEEFGTDVGPPCPQCGQQIWHVKVSRDPGPEAYAKCMSCGRLMWWEYPDDVDVAALTVKDVKRDLSAATKRRNPNSPMDMVVPGAVLEVQRLQIYDHPGEPPSERVSRKVVKSVQPIDSRHSVVRLTTGRIGSSKKFTRGSAMAHRAFRLTWNPENSKMTLTSGPPRPLRYTVLAIDGRSW